MPTMMNGSMQMFGIINFSAYLAAVLLLVLLPGPNMI